MPAWLPANCFVLIRAKASSILTTSKEARGKKCNIVNTSLSLPRPTQHAQSLSHKIGLILIAISGALSAGWSACQSCQPLCQNLAKKYPIQKLTSVELAMTCHDSLGSAMNCHVKSGKSSGRNKGKISLYCHDIDVMVTLNINKLYPLS